MRAPLFATVLAAVCLNLGCYHEEWTFRVAPDVQVFAADTTLRPGALTLIPASEAPVVAPIDSQPQHLSDAMLREKMTARSKAQLQLTKLKNDLGESHPDVLKQKELIAGIERDIAQASQQAGARQAAMASSGKPKTVLIIAQDHTGPAPLSTHIGAEIYDRYSFVLVMMLDQPLVKETVWATPENSFLITYNPYTPPQRTYAGAEGSVKILSVKGGQITADVTLRVHSDIDDSDAYYFRLPWELHGRRTFTLATPQDDLFKSGAIRYGAPKGTPVTQPIAASGAATGAAAAAPSHGD